MLVQRDGSGSGTTPPEIWGEPWKTVSVTEATANVADRSGAWLHAFTFVMASMVEQHIRARLPIPSHLSVAEQDVSVAEGAVPPSKVLPEGVLIHSFST